jgi:hypothetical protein
MRSRLPLLVTFVTLTLPTLAAADVEVHIGAGAVAELVRRTVDASKPCPQPIPVCLGNGPGPCYLDHVEVPSGGFFRRVAGETVDVPVGNGDPLSMPRLQFVQPIHVYSKTEATILDPSAEDDDYEGDLALQIALDVSAQTNAQSGKGELCLSYAGLTQPVPPGSPVFDPIPIDIGPPPQVPCMPFALDSVDALLGSGPPAGLLASVSPDLQTFAVRLRFPLSGPPSYVQMIKDAWQSFLLGSLAPGTVPANGWSLFISDGAITRSLEHRFQEEIEQSDRLDLDGDVDATWDPALGAAGGVDVEFDAEVHVDGCPITTVGLSPANVLHSFSIDAAHPALVVGAEVTWTTNMADVLLCATEFVNDAVATVAFAVGSVEALIYVPSDLPVPAECVATGETTFTCRYPIEMPKLGAGSSLHLDGGTASADGLVLSGTVVFMPTAVTPPGTPLVEVFDVTQAGGAGHTTGHCGNGTYVHDPYWAKLRPRGELCAANIVAGSDEEGVYGLQEFQMVVDDPPNDHHERVVGVIMPTDHALTCGAWLNYVCYKSHLDLFWEDPYNFFATVWSKDGARTVGLRWPDQPEQSSEKDWGDIMEEVAKFNDCLLPFIPFDLQSWEFDPPPFFALHLGYRGEQAGRVMLQNVRFEILSPIVDARGQVIERGTWLGLKADAVVEADRERYAVAVKVPFQVDWDVKRDDRGGVRGLVLAGPARAHVDFGQALPGKLENASFDLALEAGSVAVYADKQ